ncbi:MAG: N-acetylgalactosamine 6-sulfate sulfatase, partial [Roseimicrobium sp.]
LIVYYTCAAENVGTEIEATFANHAVRQVVREAHDPPAYGQENDRADRAAESYVKDFKPLHLGTIELEKTRGPLTLRALRIPGKAAIEVRYVVIQKHAINKGD